MRDGVYICESCHRKIKRNKVPCHTAADRQIIRESRTDIQTMSADRCRIQVIRKCSLCKKIFVARMLQKLCQSHDQNWYFKILNLKQNVNSKLVQVAKKPFQAPKFTL